MSALPINLDDLIHARRVESNQLEFKGTWSEQTLDQITRTIAAFANDFYNSNGGYLILGIEEQNGFPLLPPCGLEPKHIDDIQKKIRGNCKRIDPEYLPLISPEIYENTLILVIWVPAGEQRPYQAPESRNSKQKKYYVRINSETVEAQGAILDQLMQMTARIPFDDRRSLQYTLDVISPTLVRNFLAEVNSKSLSPDDTILDQELYRRMKISVKVNGYDAPKNIALLFFVNDPDQYFPGARIEVVQFHDDAGGSLIEEKIFRGPLFLQFRQALDYLNTLSGSMIRKMPHQAETQNTVGFPYEAMEEALINALYHRSYDNMPEPVKVYLYPDRMEITSYPGPVPGLELKHFQSGSRLPQVPNRNRRIGEFFKELGLAEGRSTGIPTIYRKMRENGSPPPIFDFDEARTYFRVTLPAHPQYIVIHALRESSHLWATGERDTAIRHLENAVRLNPNSGALLAQLIDYYNALGDVVAAEQAFRLVTSETLMDAYLPCVAMARLYLDHNDPAKASEMLSQTPSPSKIEEIIELAVLFKRSEQLQEAHHIFQANYESIKHNAKAVHEYAQTKIRLSSSLDAHEVATKQRLTRDAVELLRRALQLSPDQTRSAWCHFDLAKALNWLKFPLDDVRNAYEKAIELLPNERRFQEAYENWKQQRSE